MVLVSSHRLDMIYQEIQARIYLTQPISLFVLENFLVPNFLGNINIYIYCLYTHWHHLPARTPANAEDGDELAIAPCSAGSASCPPTVTGTRFSQAALLCLAGHMDGGAKACAQNAGESGVSAVKKTYGKARHQPRMQ